MPVDWGGWAVFGLVATVGLTTVMSVAQLAGFTRLDIPMVLGEIVTADLDRARILGFFLHLGAGQFFGLFYAAAFAVVGSATWWLGALFGLAHAAVALGLLVPLLPAIHPRMASDRAGLEAVVVLEPPGLFALNYGTATPLVTTAAHVAYGVALGMMLRPR